MSSQITGVKQTTAQGGSSLDNPFSRTVCGSFLQLSKVKQWGEIQFWEPIPPACSLKSERLGQNVTESQGTITQKVKARWVTGPGDRSESSAGNYPCPWFTFCYLTKLHRASLEDIWNLWKNTLQPPQRLKPLKTKLTESSSRKRVCIKIITSLTFNNFRLCRDWNILKISIS